MFVNAFHSNVLVGDSMLGQSDGGGCSMAKDFGDGIEIVVSKNDFVGVGTGESDG